MTEPFDNELAGTTNYPEEVDLDEEDIDLDDVVPSQNPLISTTGEEIESLAGEGGNQTPTNPAGNPQTGQNRASFTNAIWETESLWSYSSLGAYSDSGYPSHFTSLYTISGSSSVQKTTGPVLPSHNATSTTSAGAAKVEVAPSVQTDSGYGSVTHENPQFLRKLQTEKVVREPLDIVVERRFIEASVVQGSGDVTNTQTLYNKDQNFMSTSKTRRYILEFANHLYSRLQKQFTDDGEKSMMELLPELLEAFALKLGQTSQIQIKRDAMYFVYMHKDQIAQTMRTLFDDNRPMHAIPDTDFGAEANESSVLRQEELSAGSPVAETGDECSSEDIEIYLDAITRDPAFKWLVRRLQNVLASTGINSNAMADISSCILRNVPPVREISRQHPSKPFRVTFDVECDILGFIKDQEYHEAAAEVIPKVITLTGSLNDVQATTCEQYLIQTWPTVGGNLLQAIQSALREYKASEPLRYSCQCKFEDRTEIKVSIGERSMKVDTIGTIYSIAEIGEQIGWFAAAFRSSHADSVITFCHPEIIRFRAEDDVNLQSEEFEKAFTCRILIVTEHERENLPHIEGQCWHQMFNNPVVVVGYPIEPRGNIETGTGLELPFEMMMTLADARYLTTFDKKTVVKGFSTALIPMRQQENLLIWHLLADVSGARISYRDPRIQQGILISSDTFESTRHILGWCSDVQNDIGSPRANYDIEYSGLSQLKGNLSWEKIELSVGAGNYFKVGTTFTRGKKDRMISKGISDGYVSRVEHIGKQYIMLYDVKEERAWLSDGLPVLLHLVRTSLRRDENEDPDGLIMKHIKKLNEAPPSAQGTMAAKAVLFDDENRLISLRLKDTKVTEQTIERTINGETINERVRIKEKIYIRLENRVEEICHHLEQTIDETAKAINEGVLRRAPRSVLGGFDFMGVATRENLRLITTNMSIPDGSGWTDLLDSIAAITLWGKDFGELIKPRVAGLVMGEKACNNCGFNANLPLGKNLLAGCADVLEKIIEKGNKDTTPWRLIDDVYWHFNEAAFGRCWCTSSNEPPSRRCFDDRIQILSSKNTRLHPVLSRTNIPKNGAVIFGHGRKRGLALMSRNIGVGEDDSSQEDITHSQTPLGVSSSSETSNEGSETNENHLSDIVSSNTPNTSTSSRMDGSGLTSNHQASDAESSITPDDSMSSKTPGLNDISVDQHSPSSDVASTKPEITTVPPYNTLEALPVPPRRRPIRKMKAIYTRAWKKLNRD